MLCLLTNSGVISPKKELRLISLCKPRIEGMSFSASFKVLPEFRVQRVSCAASIVPLLILLISEFWWSSDCAGKPARRKLAKIKNEVIFVPRCLIICFFSLFVNYGLEVILFFSRPLVIWAKRSSYSFIVCACQKIKSLIDNHSHYSL